MKITSILIVIFLVIATAFPILRLLGNKDADLPAFGVLITSLVIMNFLNLSVYKLNRKVDDMEIKLKQLLENNK